MAEIAENYKSETHTVEEPSWDEARLSLEISEKGIFYNPEEIKKIREKIGLSTHFFEGENLPEFYLPNGNVVNGRLTQITPYSIVIEGDKPILYAKRIPVGEIVFQNSSSILTGSLNGINKVLAKLSETAGNTILNPVWHLKVLPPVLLILAWESASRLGYLKPLILPAPTAILKAFYSQLASGELEQHIGISLYRIFKGYVVGAGLGLQLGILIGISKKFDYATSLVLNFLRPIPMFAWMPLIILWLGVTEATKTSIIAIGCFWPVLLNVIDAIKSVDKKYLEVARILEKNKHQVLTKVVFPSALPQIITGLRIGMGMAWMAVVAAEVIASTSGIGFMLTYSREMWQPDITFVGIFSIGIIGLIIENAFSFIEHRLIKWRVNNGSSVRKR